MGINDPTESGKYITQLIRVSFQSLIGLRNCVSQKELTVPIKPMSTCKWDSSENFIELVVIHVKLWLMILQTHTHILFFV